MMGWYRVLFIVALLWQDGLQGKTPPPDDLKNRLERIQQQHLDALQLSLNYPEKGRRAHANVAGALTAIFMDHNYGMTIDPGVLAYNIGSSWYHGSRYGESILWYRRAEVLGFSDRRLHQNLEVVRGKRLDNLPDHFGPLWLTTLYEWSSYGLWWLSAALIYLLFWWQLWHFTKRRVVMGQSPASAQRLIVTSAALLVMVASLCFHTWYNPASGDGVILTHKVEARKGPGLVYSGAFTHPLNAGTEFIVLQRQRRWLEVSLSSGEVVWLPESAVEQVQW